MFIDCGTCALRAIECADCVVSVMLDEPDVARRIDPAQVRALRVLADEGLAPPLRMTPVVERAS